VRVSLVVHVAKYVHSLGMGIPAQLIPIVLTALSKTYILTPPGCTSTRGRL